jgi:hypothetical protein
MNTRTITITTIHFFSPISPISVDNSNDINNCITVLLYNKISAIIIITMTMTITITITIIMIIVCKVFQ